MSKPKAAKPNEKKGGKNQNASSDILQTENLLQALILADSFDQKFTPITVEAPRVSKIFLMKY